MIMIALLEHGQWCGTEAKNQEVGSGDSVGIFACLYRLIGWLNEVVPQNS